MKLLGLKIICKGHWGGGDFELTPYNAHCAMILSFNQLQLF